MIALADLHRLGVAGPLDLASSALRGVVRQVRFRSNVTPAYSWDPSSPAAPSSGEPSSFADLGAFVQPAVDVTLTNGQTFTVAPAGEPTGDYRVYVAGVGFVVVAGLGLAGALGYALGRRARR